MYLNTLMYRIRALGPGGLGEADAIAPSWWLKRPIAKAAEASHTFLYCSSIVIIVI